MDVGGGTIVIDANWKERTDAQARKELAELALALNRDNLWFERELRSMVKATALSGDKMREAAAGVLERAKKRRQRTMKR